MNKLTKAEAVLFLKRSERMLEIYTKKGFLNKETKGRVVYYQLSELQLFKKNVMPTLGLPKPCEPTETISNNDIRMMLIDMYNKGVTHGKDRKVFAASVIVDNYLKELHNGL